MYQQALHSNDKSMLKELENKKQKTVGKINRQIKRLSHQLGRSNVTDVSKKLAIFTPRKNPQKYGSVNKALENFKTFQQTKDIACTHHYEKIKTGIQKSTRIGNAVKTGIPSPFLYYLLLIKHTLQMTYSKKLVLKMIKLKH